MEGSHCSNLVNNDKINPMHNKSASKVPRIYHFRQHNVRDMEVNSLASPVHPTTWRIDNTGDKGCSSCLCLCVRIHRDSRAGPQRGRATPPNQLAASIRPKGSSMGCLREHQSSPMKIRTIHGLLPPPPPPGIACTQSQRASN